MSFLYTHFLNATLSFQSTHRHRRDFFEHRHIGFASICQTLHVSANSFTIPPPCTAYACTDDKISSERKMLSRTPLSSSKTFAPLSCALSRVICACFTLAASLRVLLCGCSSAFSPASLNERQFRDFASCSNGSVGLHSNFDYFDKLLF